MVFAHKMINQGKTLHLKVNFIFNCCYVIQICTLICDYSTFFPIEKTP